MYSDEGRMRRVSRKKRVFMELQDLHRQSSSTSSRKKDTMPISRSQQQMKNESSPAVLCCLCMLLVLGMTFKVAGSFVSGRLWEGLLLPDGETVHVVAAACSILIPMVGVAAIKNMQGTKDVRNTMELSIPACSLGSLVGLLCFVVVSVLNEDHQVGEGGDCISSYFWEVVTRETRY